MELGELKEFLRIDGDDQDLVLKGYQEAAEEYLRGAGVKVGYENKLYKIVITIIVATMIESPDLMKQNTAAGNISLSALVVQLR